MFQIIDDKLFLAQDNLDYPAGPLYTTIRMNAFQYFPFCDDFGPLNLSCVTRFIEALELEQSKTPASSIVIYSESGERALTNAVFVLGAYLVIKRKIASGDVVDKFRGMNHSLIVPYRDATHSPAEFGLTLEDCWGGLERSVILGWLAPPKPDQPNTYGLFNMDEYDHYDDPLNGDLHEVVPGKFIAMKGPKDLGGREYHDDSNGHRNFSPAYYADILHELGVVAVVRLNEPEYDSQEFVRRGIRVNELEFEDCTPPPDSVARAFLLVSDIAHASGGAVAVHCRAGLGRTGTLIALYMMRSCGFSARQAIGWLRIVRPGSVIGEQQQYLCRVERGAALSPVQRRSSVSCTSLSSHMLPTSSMAAASYAGPGTKASARTARARSPPRKPPTIPQHSASRRRVEAAFDGAAASRAAQSLAYQPSRLARRAGGAGISEGAGVIGSSASSASDLAAQVAGGMEQRSAARARRSSAYAILSQ